MTPKSPPRPLGPGHYLPAPAGIVLVILLPFTQRPSNNFDPRFSLAASGSGFGVDAETGADERCDTPGLVAGSFKRCREPTAVSGKKTYQKPATGSKIWTMFGAAGKSVAGFVGPLNHDRRAL